jgi:hypothetical protein
VPEEIEISFEEFPQADTGLQPPIIQQENPARGAVYADDALVAVNGQQHTYGLPLRRHYRDDPFSMELLSKKSLFYSARAVSGSLTRLQPVSPWPMVFPPTTLMTGNTTQAVIEAVDIMNGAAASTSTNILERFGRTIRSVIWFAVGCALSAVLFYFFGFWCLAVPVIVSGATVILEEK